MEFAATALIIIVGIGLIVLIIKIFGTPLRWLLKLALNTATGFVALFLLNFFGGFIGLSLGINWFNAIVVGVLGVPGVALLLLLKYLL